MTSPEPEEVVVEYPVSDGSGASATAEVIPDLLTLLDMYGDLADVPPALLAQVRDLVVDNAWREAVAEAEVVKAAEVPFSIGGLAYLAHKLSNTSRPAQVERYAMKALEVERAGDELLALLDRVAVEADDFMDRDPSRGEDAEDRKRLQAERDSLLKRLTDHAVEIVTKAERLRSLL